VLVDGCTLSPREPHLWTASVPNKGVGYLPAAPGTGQADGLRAIQKMRFAPVAPLPALTTSYGLALLP